MTFKPKAVRPSSRELLATVGRVAAEGGQLPTAPEPTAGQIGAREVAAPVRRPAPPTVLVNFKATMPFAKLIAESIGEGGRRQAHGRENDEGRGLRRPRTRPEAGSQSPHLK